MCRNYKIRGEVFGTKLDLPRRREKSPLEVRWEYIRQRLDREAGDQRTRDLVSDLCGLERDSLPFEYMDFRE